MKAGRGPGDDRCGNARWFRTTRLEAQDDVTPSIGQDAMGEFAIGKKTPDSFCRETAAAVMKRLTVSIRQRHKI